MVQSESGSRISVKDQVKAILIQFNETSKQFEMLLQSQRNMEAKLREFEIEKARQKLINDQLLTQLMKREEEKQIFQKLLVLVKEFIEKHTKPKSEAAQPTPQDVKKEDEPQMEKMADVNKMEQTSQMIEQNVAGSNILGQIDNPNKVLEDTQMAIRDLQSLVNGQVQHLSEVNQQDLSAKVNNQLEQLKNQIYQGQWSNSAQQNQIQSFIQQVNQILPTQQNNNSLSVLK